LPSSPDAVGPSWGRETAATHGQHRYPADSQRCSSTPVIGRDGAAGPYMACKGSGVQIPSAPPQVRGPLRRRPPPDRSPRAANRQQSALKGRSSVRHAGRLSAPDFDLVLSGSAHRVPDPGHDPDPVVVAHWLGQVHGGRPLAVVGADLVGARAHPDRRTARTAATRPGRRRARPTRPTAARAGGRHPRCPGAPWPGQEF